MATIPGSKRLLDISGNNISTAVSLEASGTLLDVNGVAGTSGQVLSSTGSTVDWVDPSTVIGGPYVTIGTTQTITGAKTFSTLLSGTSASFSSYVYAGGGVRVRYAGASKMPMIVLNGATTYGLFHTEGTPDIFSFDFNGTPKQQFFENGNATFAGDLTVSGGDITLGATGRIQGIDTVSAGTDAANKTYVDTKVASVGGSTTIASTGGTTPAISAITGTVNSGSSVLATGAQIQSAINIATTGTLKFISEWSAAGTAGGSPDLQAVGTHTPGNYYIVSVAGSAVPNGTGTTPDEWAVGDWVIRADLATDTWQKIDNTQVVQLLIIHSLL